MLDDVDRKILSQSKALRSLVEYPEWKVFTDIIEAQIKTRQDILYIPLHMMAEGQLPGAGFEEKAAHLESIKGTLYGLKLILDLPQITMDHAELILKHEEMEGTPVDDD